MTRRRKRHPDTIRRVAFAFEVHERTLRRWIARPELRPVLRAYRHGKQWRLDVPKTALAFARYKRDVLRAVRPFRRKRRNNNSRPAQEIARAFGYDEEHKILRERGLRILRQAIDLRLANTKLPRAFKRHSQTHTVRIIAAKLGLYGNDIFKVHRYLDRTDSNHRQILKFWPTQAQWKQAASELERHWRKRTLAEAAYELVKENKSITGENLTPFLFLNEGRELMWKQHEKLRQIPDAYLPTDIYSYGRRGISLRLFRQRYKRSDVAEARGTIIRSEGRAKDRKDSAGYGSAVTIRSGHSKDINQDKDALHVEDRTKVRIGASAMRAIRGCEEALREAKTDAERKRLQDYLRELKSQENFSRIY